MVVHLPAGVPSIIYGWDRCWADRKMPTGGLVACAELADPRLLLLCEEHWCEIVGR